MKNIREQFKFPQSSNQFYTMLDLNITNIENFKIQSFESNNKEIEYRLSGKDLPRGNLQAVIKKILQQEPNTVRIKSDID